MVYGLVVIVTLLLVWHETLWLGQGPPSCGTGSQHIPPQWHTSCRQTMLDLLHDGSWLPLRPWQWRICTGHNTAAVAQIPFLGTLCGQSWVPSQRYLPQRSASAMVQCVQKGRSKWVLFAGDSNMRRLFDTLLEDLRRDAAHTIEHHVPQANPGQDQRWVDQDVVLSSSSSPCGPVLLSLRFVNTRQRLLQVLEQPSLVVQRQQTPAHSIAVRSFSTLGTPTARLLSHGLWSETNSAASCEALKPLAMRIRDSNQTMSVWISLGKLREDHTSKQISNVATRASRDCQAALSRNFSVCSLDMFRLSDEAGHGNCHAGQPCEGWAGWAGDGYHYEPFVYDVQIQVFFEAVCMRG